MRDEIEGDRITVSVDGPQICESRRAVPFAGGHIGLMAYRHDRGAYPGKAFARVRVYARGIPEKLPATAIGDLFVQRQDFDEAAKQYHRVAESHGGSRIGSDAVYREGLCRCWQGRYDDAERIWTPLAGGGYEPLLELQRLDRAASLGHHDELLAGMERLFAAGSADIRHRVAIQWCRYLTALTSDPTAGGGGPIEDDAMRTLVTRYVDLRDRLFGDDVITDKNAARALLALGRWTEVVDGFPNLRFERGEALIYLRRFDLAAEEYPDPAAFHDTTLLAMAVPPRSATIHR